MFTNRNYSENPKINILIESILDELCPFLEEQAREISDLTAIGKALGTGQDISTLLEMILSIARRFTQADGGTLYLVDKQNRFLHFHVIFNESLGISRSGSDIDFPPVPLYLTDGSTNLANVSSHVFHTGKIVNIKDVYDTGQFEFAGTRKFDRSLNYRSKSMVVIPMTNHEDEIIGILQLINALDLKTRTPRPFSTDAQEKAAALASQASVILTQQTLILEMKELFEAFIKAIAVSIDEKSKHTGGHIQRVTELSMMISEKINQDRDFFKDVVLSVDQINELRIAALMHDTGKITTPDHIMNKSSRLETVFDRIELIRTRWELFRTSLKLAAAEEKLARAQDPDFRDKAEQIDLRCEKEIRLLDRELDILEQINQCKTRLTQTHIDGFRQIRDKAAEITGSSVPYLTEEEKECLSITNGTLTESEREVINSHADLTERILNKLPWPKKMAKIPAIAGAHHEKLDGSGYPLKLDKSSLNLQARILAISDIFEALSAQDRPYKNPMPLSRTKVILEQMGKDGLLDREIIDLFFRDGVHIAYAGKHLSPDQIDL